MQRVRVQFSKDGPMRFTAHLDLAQTWERLLRRATVPVAYTKGYNPQPRLNLAAALPLGFTSQCELVDILLEIDDEETVQLDQLLDQLRSAAPPGLTVHNAETVALKEKALQVHLTSIEYRVMIEAPPDLADRVESLLAAETLERERRGKTYDLRPLVEQVCLGDLADKIWMRLTARPGGVGRPDEVLSALGLDPLAAHIHRTQMFFTPQ